MISAFAISLSLGELSMGLCARELKATVLPLKERPIIVHYQSQLEKLTEAYYKVFEESEPPSESRIHHKVTRIEKKALRSLDRHLKRVEQRAPQKEADEADTSEKRESDELLEKAYLEYRYWNFRLGLGSAYESEAVEAFEKIRERAPDIEEVWMTLSDHYTHRGPIEKSFEYIEYLTQRYPSNPDYWENLATLLVLFRGPEYGQKFLGLKSDEAVFDVGISYYKKAIDLDPQSYKRRKDLAESFWLLKPIRIEEALAAWHNALQYAFRVEERDEAVVALGRIYGFLGSDFKTTALSYLDMVTTPSAVVQAKKIKSNIESGRLSRQSR